MTQEKFDTIYQRAAHRKGGAAELEKIVRAPLPKPSYRRSPTIAGWPPLPKRYSNVVFHGM